MSAVPASPAASPFGTLAKDVLQLVMQLTDSHSLLALARVSRITFAAAQSDIAWRGKLVQVSAEYAATRMRGSLVRFVDLSLIWHDESWQMKAAEQVHAVITPLVRLRALRFRVRLKPAEWQWLLSAPQTAQLRIVVLDVDVASFKLPELTTLAEQLPLVHTLGLTIGGTCAVGFLSPLAQMQSLTDLRLSMQYAGREADHIGACSSLRKLTWTQQSTVSHDVILANAQLQSSLVELTLQRCHANEPASWITVLSKMNALRVLRLQHVFVIDACLSHLAQCESAAQQLDRLEIGVDARPNTFLHARSFEQRIVVPSLDSINALILARPSLHLALFLQPLGAFIVDSGSIEKRLVTDSWRTTEANYQSAWKASGHVSVLPRAMSENPAGPSVLAQTPHPAEPPSRPLSLRQGSQEGGLDAQGSSVHRNHGAESSQMAVPTPRPPSSAEARRQIARNARRAAQAAWRALSPAQRCSADTVSTILSLLSLSEIARASSVCRGWQAGAAKVTRVHGHDGRFINAAKKLTAAEAQRRNSEALVKAEEHPTESAAPLPPTLAMAAEDPLQVGCRLRSLISSPLRRHIHTLDETLVDASLRRWSRWDDTLAPASPPRPFSFLPSYRWSGSWSLADLRALSALPHLTRLLGCTVQMRDFVFRSVATAQFQFSRRLKEISLSFEWSEPEDVDRAASSSASHDAHKADLATCLPIMRALVGCTALTSLSLETELPLQFDISPLSELPALERLSVDCPVTHWSDRLYLAPALRQIALVDLSVRTNTEEVPNFVADFARALFTRPHKLDGLCALRIGFKEFSQSELEAIKAAE